MSDNYSHGIDVSSPNAPTGGWPLPDVETKEQEKQEMAITAEAKGGEFVEAPVGTHIARCWQIIDLGRQKNEYQGDVSIKHQVLISWELPALEQMDDGRPVSISKFYTLSLHEKSNMGQDLSSWRGKAFTDEEKMGFDITKLLGVPCMLSVIEKNGKSRVQSVMAPPKGTEIPAQMNPSVCFDMQEYLKGDTAVYDALTDGLRRLIDKSEDLKGAASQEFQQPVIDDNLNDDIPF